MTGKEKQLELCMIFCFENQKLDSPAIAAEGYRRAYECNTCDVGNKHSNAGKRYLPYRGARSPTKVGSSMCHNCEHGQH